MRCTAGDLPTLIHRGRDSVFWNPSEAATLVVVPNHERRPTMPAHPRAERRPAGLIQLHPGGPRVWLPSLSTALAELVDNSLQAGATSVAITIRREGRRTPADRGRGQRRWHGVSPNCAPAFASAAHRASMSRHSFGRFGMGLPAASLSQARRVEVTSWQRRRARAHGRARCRCHRLRGRSPDLAVETAPASVRLRLPRRVERVRPDRVPPTGLARARPAPRPRPDVPALPRRRICA